MITPLTWLTVTVSFRMNSIFLWSTPISWDPATRRYKYDNRPGKVRRHFFWYFVVFFCFLLISGGSSLYIVYWQMVAPRKNIGVANLIMFMMIGLAALFAAGMGFSIHFVGENAMYMVNAFHRYAENFEKWHHSLTGRVITENGRISGISGILKALLDFRNPIWKNADGKLDVIGLSLFSLLTPMAFWSFPATLIIVFSYGFDVYRFVLEDIWAAAGVEGDYRTVIADKLIRCFLTYTVFAEGSRLFPFIVFIYVIVAIRINAITSNFYKIAAGLKKSKNLEYKKLSRLFHYFNALGIASNEVLDHMSGQNFVMMSTGALLAAFLSFFTIRMLSAEEFLAYYLIGPFLAVIIMLAIYTLLPYAIALYEKPLSALRAAKECLMGVGKLDGYYRRRLAGLRPMRTCAGIMEYYFFKLDRSVMGTFTMTIVDYTINLLLAFPSIG